MSNTTNSQIGNKLLNDLINSTKVENETPGEPSQRNKREHTNFPSDYTLKSRLARCTSCHQF